MAARHIHFCWGGRPLSIEFVQKDRGRPGEMRDDELGTYEDETQCF